MEVKGLRRNVIWLRPFHLLIINCQCIEYFCANWAHWKIQKQRCQIQHQLFQRIPTHISWLITSVVEKLKDGLGMQHFA